MEKARETIRKALEIIKKTEMRILPGQIAFFLVMSLIPLIALIGAIGTKMSISVDSINHNVGTILPKGMDELLKMILVNKNYNFNITVFFISAFVLASNGPHSMIIASNQIYEIKSKNIAIRRLKAILMTFIVVLLFFFLLIVPIWGDYIIEVSRIITNNSKQIEFLAFLYQFLKYPILAAVLYLSIKVLYVIAPDQKIERDTTIKGSVFTTIGWMIATKLYATYIDRFSNYDIFYGSISNILILLLWVYILSYIFVLGMIMNAADIKKEKQKESTEK